LSVDTAIVLAGGYATRLRPLTLTRPKALLPVLGKPILDWILEGLKSAGVYRVFMSVRYLADMIKSRYGDGGGLGIKIEYVEEINPLGDAGPVPLIVNKYGIKDPFLVVYSDIFSNINFAEVIKHHLSNSGLVTIALTKVEDPSRYGVAVLDADNKVVSFVEKPQGVVSSNLINAGVYVFQPQALKYFPSKTPSKLAIDVIPKVVKDGELYGYVHEGLWLDIGVPKDYLEANIKALKHFMPEGHVSNEAELSEDATIIQPSFIDRNVKVGKASVIGPYAVVGYKTLIGSNSRVKNSVLLNNVVLEPAAHIEYSVVGEGTHIGKWVRISEGCVLGDEVTIGDEVYIAKNTVILPHKEVNENVETPGKILL